MRNNNGVERWTNCNNSLSIGLKDEEGHALREEGYIENFACESPDIVSSGRYPTKDFLDQGGISQAAVLHEIGKTDNPEVIAALDKSCGKCISFKKRG